MAFVQANLMDTNSIRTQTDKQTENYMFLYLYNCFDSDKVMVVMVVMVVRPVY